MNGSDEVWRTVVDQAGYEVSNLGRVRSFRVSPRGRLMTPFQAVGGRYLQVTVAAPRRRRYVHELVATAFLGPRPAGHQIAHWNGDGLDNRVENLRYATPAENQDDRLRHGRDNRGEKSGTAKLTREDVMEIRRRYGPYSKNGRGRAQGGDTQRSLAAEYGVSWQRIGSIVRGETWSHLFDSSLDDVAARLDRLIS